MSASLLEPPTLIPIQWPVHRSRIALQLPDAMPLNDWREMGVTLCGMDRGVQWWIGDWWSYGEHTYGSRAKAVAEGVFGNTPFQSLMNVGSIAKRFPASRRQEGVSFTHHAEVAALPEDEADAILSEAAEQKWSTRDLRAEVQRRRATPEQPQPAIKNAPPATSFNPRMIRRMARLVRAAFCDWFGIGEASASLLMALFEAGGDTIPPRTLATSADSHRPLSAGALHEAISSLRKSLESEAVDTNEEGYCLTEIGLMECRRAFREIGAIIMGIGQEPANDGGEFPATGVA